MTHIEFIKTMIEEKGISLDTCLLEKDGHIGLTVQMLLDFIAQMHEHSIRAIKDCFSKIDFQNGDLMHYMNHLAWAMNKSLKH